jgi:hypothetical protein
MQRRWAQENDHSEHTIEYLATRPNAGIEEDRFQDRGENIIREAALTSINLLQSLPAEEADNFAVSLRDTAAELIAKQQQRSAAISKAAASPPSSFQTLSQGLKSGPFLVAGREQ